MSIGIGNFMMNFNPLILSALTKVANDALQNTLIDDNINNFNKGKHVSPGLMITHLN